MENLPRISNPEDKQAVLFIDNGIIECFDVKGNKLHLRVSSFRFRDAGAYPVHCLTAVDCDRESRFEYDREFMKSHDLDLNVMLDYFKGREEY